MNQFDFTYVCKNGVYLDFHEMWIYDAEIYIVIENKSDSIKLKCTFGLNKGKFINISHSLLAENFTTALKI